jgi:ornithine decarboxylase
MIQPFIPPIVDGRIRGRIIPPKAIASERRFFSFAPGAHWRF